MKHRILSQGTGLFAVAISLTANGGNWPAWRGPEGTGITGEKNLPLQWSTNENVRWRVELPGPGNSSPIIWGDRVFITQAVEKEHRRTVMCFDRASGKLKWQSGISYPEHESTQESNPYCAGTPATDGKLVYACFGSAGVYAYDFEGKEAWHRDLGKINHMFGNAISPVVYEDLCILNFGPDPKARLVALNKKNGETVWEADPPKPDDNERLQGPGGRGFGPGMFMAPAMLSQGDKDSDKKLTKDEFVGLANAWFDKVDTEKKGDITETQLVEKFGDLLPPPPGFAGRDGGPPGQRQGPGGGRGGGNSGRFIGPGLFAAADTDKDGKLTREEWTGAFANWFAKWDSDRSGSIDENQLREGLNSVLPRPQMGGPGGGGGGRGPGGPGGSGGPGGMDPSGSWSTPVIVKTGGRKELVVSFPNRLVGFDPKTGKQLWMSKGLSSTVYTTPIWSAEAIVAISSGMGNGSAVAVKPGGNGDVTESQRLWRLERVKNQIGSGVIHGDLLFTIGSEGIVECLDLKTGKKMWDERLQGPSSKNSSWSSMLLAGDKIYVPNQSGDVFVLKAGPKFELLATNSVNEPTNASLAAADENLFLRTDQGLWCFASK